MASIHFPVYTLLILLGTAAVIPLLAKGGFSRIKTLMYGALASALLLSGLTLASVYTNGAYLYHFGNWNQKIGIQFSIDEFSALMAFFLLVVASCILIYAFRDMEHEIDESQFAGYYTLVFILLFSMVGITLTNDLFNMYVFMEILSLTSCSIISIKQTKENYLASFRYLILNTIGSLSVMFGIALIYMITGSLNMQEAAQGLAAGWQLYPTNILVVIGFMMTGLAIKSAVFPLHIWQPDAYSAAPTPSSALLSGLVGKVYIFTVIKLLMRVLGFEIVGSLNLSTVITYFAATGIIMGSFFAIGQKDIKRMLAYSSVAQVGYVFLGIGLGTEQGLSAALFQVVAHSLMKVSLFLSVGAVIYYKGKRDIRELDGIGYEMPITMTVFSLAAFGMIGIPGVNGFMSKIYLGFAVLDAGKPFYLIIILLSSLLNSFYYLPIIISAFLKEGKDRKNVMVLEKLPKPMLFSLIGLGAACVIMGFLPDFVMNAITKAIPVLMP